MHEQSREPQTIEVIILIFPECSMMCVASIIEPLRAANRVSGNELYRWRLMSVDGEPVYMTCGLPIAAEAKFDATAKGDIFVVIGGFNQYRHLPSRTVASIRKSASNFQTFVGVEAGSWVLARAGLLDGYEATTHWEDFEPFSEQFPEVSLKRDRFVIDRNRITCGGASPAFDMFLEMIRKRNGPAIALEVSTVFVYDESHSQFDSQPLISLGRAASKEPRLEQAVRLMEKWIEQPLPIAAIAKRIGVSSNTLEKIFRNNLEMTPGQFYLHLRLKNANRMVLDTGLSLREIAVRSGFNSLSAFSRAFSKKFGRPARDFRSPSAAMPSLPDR